MIFPNLANSDFINLNPNYFSFPLGRAEIFDCNGNTILKVEIPENANAIKKIDLPRDLISGFYIVKAIGVNGQEEIGKFLIKK